MKKFIYTGLVMLAAVTAFAGGNCEKASSSLAKSQTVKTVPEKDDEGEVWEDSGVSYYKIKLSPGAQATVWITGGNAADLELDVYADLDSDSMVDFEAVEEFGGGAVKAAYLYADSWDEEDTTTTFYVCVSGDVGLSTTLNYSSSIVGFTVTGEEDSPQSLTFKTSEQKITGKMVTDAGTYWCKAKLLAGRAYSVRTLKGTDENDLDVEFDSEAVEMIERLDYADVNSNNVKYVVMVENDGTYKFYVSGAEYGSPFALYYQQLPARTPAQHPYVDLADSGNWSASVVPGRLNDSWERYDLVADESLCRIYLTKGERWYFETVGADDAEISIKMDIYDASGNLLKSNESKGNKSSECRIAYEAPATGYYYVGVYDPLLTPDDEAPETQILVTAAKCDTVKEKDAWDPVDDLYSGATAVAAASAKKASDAFVAAAALSSGPHILNAGDWYDCYAIACRKGLTYRLAVALEDEEATTDLTLAAKVFTLTKDKKGKLVESALTTSGSLLTSDGTGGLVFTAKDNCINYVRVQVAEGIGLDFPQYRLYAIAYDSNDADLGALQVFTKGAEGMWSLGSEKKYYPNGATVNVAAGEKTVTFSAVTGFATPADAKGTVVAGSTAKVIGVYNDTYDKYQITKNKKKVTVTDDDATGPFTLAQTGGKTLSELRTLWEGDPVDNFLFTAVEGVFYNFTLKDTTLDAEGDAKFTICGDGVGKGGQEVVAATTAVSKRRFNAGLHTLAVKHGNSPASDSSYTLEYSTFNAGTVRFAAVTNTIAENTEYVTVKVQRTAAEGEMMVYFATQEGDASDKYLAAVPGEHYYPTNGVIAWANGDKTDKTITVRLLPSIVAGVEKPHVFGIRLWGKAEDEELGENEYPATITRDTTAIVINEATKKAAGKVSPVAYGDEDTPFANAKKPVMSVVAGKNAEFTLRRSDFTAMTKVAVKVTAVSDKKKYKDTAVVGMDFETFSEVLTWEDGDEDEQTVSIPTLEREGDYTMSRQFTVTLVAMTTGTYKGWDKPTLGASAVTVKITNPTAVKSYSTFAAEAKQEGVVTAASKGSNWFVDSDGSYRNAETTAAVTTTFTVVGPGLFVADPAIEGCDGTFTCKIGSAAEFDCSCGGRFAKIVPSGSQKIVFKFQDPTGKSYGVLNRLPENDLPYKWVPFSSVTSDLPYDKSKIALDSEVTLAWTVPEELGEENVYYRVRFGKGTEPSDLVTNITDECCCKLPDSVVLAGDATYSWRVEYAYIADADVAAALANPESGSVTWTPGPSVWQFSTGNGTTQTTKVSGTDTFGNDFYDGITNNTPIQLVQGVKVRFEIGPSEDDSSCSRVLVGSLPPGLTLNGAAKQGVISGTPTTPGDYTVVLQSARKDKAKSTSKKTVHDYCTSEKLIFHVAPLGTAIGTFRGVLVEDGNELASSPAAKIGTLTFSATSAGKITAKATVAGVTYSFSSTGYDEVWRQDEDTLGIDKELALVINATQKFNNNKIVCNNTLELAMGDGKVEDLDSFVENIASAKLHLKLVSAKQNAVIGETDFVCERLVRDNGKVDAMAESLAAYQGYYTVALTAPGADPEVVPAGTGYLTMTVSADGTVKLGGRLADGTAVSGTSFGSLIGNDPTDPQQCEFLVPVVFSSGTYGFGGWLSLKWSIDGDGNPTTTVDSTQLFSWFKNGTSATAIGDPFELSVEPVGGWYNTIWNLQRYYVDYEFMLDGVPLTLNGNAVKLAANKGETVSAVTYSLARATGLTSGTLTYAGTKKIMHYGVLTMNRDAASSMSDDIWTAGFFLHKVNSSWTESLPFDILCSGPADTDWSEVTVPEYGE